MNLSTEPVVRLNRDAAEPRTAAQWLDALSSGTCDEADLVRAVGDVLRRAPEAGWETLALLDQYYRRGKISAATFGKLKSHLQALLMGDGSIPDVPTLTVALSPATVALSPPRASPSAPPPPPPPPPAGRLGRTLVDLDGAAAAPHSGAERSIAVGDLLRGRYRVQALLGQGGMGTVFEAIDEFRVNQPIADQRVAIKVLHTAVIQRPSLFAELRREFQHLQSLSHPNIVRVHEFDRDGDLAFFTMEYLSGALLSRVLLAHESSALDPAYAFAIIRDVGAAVAHAHARGIVHGDLNPGNIFVTDSGEIRVLDFGASHRLRQGPWISEFENPQPIMVATLTYASCQVLQAETPDARDDVYALACILYALLTGKQPFGEHSALRARTLGLRPKRPAGLGRRQWHALRAGLEFARERRPRDLSTWLGELNLRDAAAHLPALPTLLATTPRRRRGIAPAVNGGLIMLIAACAWWAATHADSLARAGAAVRAGMQSIFSGTDGSPPLPAKPEAAAAAAKAQPTPQRVPEPLVKAVTAAPRAAATTPTAGIPPSRVSAAAILPTAPRRLAAAAPAPAQAVNAPQARIELASDTVEVPVGDPMAHVIVRRTRGSRGDVSFHWWTESGTAKPGRDFTPVREHEEQIGDGKSAADLFIPIVVDPARHDSRSFYVVIDAASDNAALGARTLTMVTISGSDASGSATSGSE